MRESLRLCTIEVEEEKKKKKDERRESVEDLPYTHSLSLYSQIEQKRDSRINTDNEREREHHGYLSPSSGHVVPPGATVCQTGLRNWFLPYASRDTVMSDRVTPQICPFICTLIHSFSAQRGHYLS